jgi:hypothetical protein
MYAREIAIVGIGLDIMGTCANRGSANNLCNENEDNSAKTESAARAL